jgi:hypothetical protein
MGSTRYRSECHGLEPDIATHAAPDYVRLAAGAAERQTFNAAA